MTEQPDDADRRHLLKLALSAGALAMSVSWPGFALARPSARGKYLFVPGRVGEDYALAVIDPRSLKLLSSIRLPARAHGVLRDPHRPEQLLVFSRRPGTTIWRVDIRRGAVLRSYESAEDRHFFGHGVYSADGRHLYVSENDTDSGQGRISLRRSDTLAVVDEFSSGGIGPHELLLLADGRLAVANGGLLTLPETGRVKLNRERMQPSLVYLDARNGERLSEHRLEDMRLSIRHLAPIAGGVAMALQFEGNPLSGAPLLALQRGSATPVLADEPGCGWAALHGYAASVLNTGERIVISCPKAGRVAAWDGQGRAASEWELPGVAGLAATEGQVFLSSETDGLQLRSKNREPDLSSRPPSWQWDNHAYYL